MRQWQTEVPRLTANEADQVVDLWLRQRLTAVDEVPVDPRALTIPELAVALGAREEDVAVLLCHIRDRRTARKIKPAIPVRKSWFYIAAIYACFIVLGSALFGFGFRQGNRSAGRWMARGSFGYVRQPYFDRTAGHSRIPEEFGFRYRNTLSPGSQRAPESVSVVSGDGGLLYKSGTDWEQAEKGLINAANQLNADVPKALSTTVTDSEIASAVAYGRQRGISSVIQGDRLEPEQVDKDRLISWSAFSITRDGRTVTAYLPATKVTDESLDKAVNGIVKDRISRMLKLLKSLTATDSGAELHSTSFNDVTSGK
jgi:hypothetical protein